MKFLDLVEEYDQYVEQELRLFEVLLKYVDQYLDVLQQQFLLDQQLLLVFVAEYLHQKLVGKQIHVLLAGLLLNLLQKVVEVLDILVDAHFLQKPIGARHRNHLILHGVQKAVVLLKLQQLKEIGHVHKLVQNADLRQKQLDSP